MLLLGTFTFIAVRARYPESLPRRGTSQRMTLLIAFSAISVYALLLFGAHVTSTGAALVYPDWPFFGGSLVPNYSADGAIASLQLAQFLHRFVAAIVAVILLGTAVIAWRGARGKGLAAGIPGAPGVLGLVGTAAALFAVEVVVGALQIFTALAPWAVTLHLALGAAVWALLAGATFYAYFEARAAGHHEPGWRRRRRSGGGSGRRGRACDRPQTTLRERVNAYVALTKPRIIELLLVTTVPAMILARWRVMPDMGLLPFGGLVLVTLLGGTLAAGSANAINCYLDRDIDLLMTRTRRRPLPAHAVAPEDALAFGLALGVVAFAILAFFVNLVAAFLTLLAIGVLRGRLHHAAEAEHAPEHRARRRGRGPAAGHRLGGRDRRHHAALAAALRDRLLLDAAPLLGAVDAHPRRLRGGQRADDAGDPRRPGDDAPDRAVLGADGLR